MVLDAVERLGRHKIGHSEENSLSNHAEGIPVTPLPVEGYVVSAEGLEPSTHALKGHCSTN